jgi:hypothetical protein
MLNPKQALMMMMMMMMMLSINRPITPVFMFYCLSIPLKILVHMLSKSNLEYGRKQICSLCIKSDSAVKITSAEKPQHVSHSFRHRNTTPNTYNKLVLNSYVCTNINPRQVQTPIQTP